MNLQGVAGKFQKWKMEIRWYEPEKQPFARVNFENVEFCKAVHRLVIGKRMV